MYFLFSSLCTIYWLATIRTHCEIVFLFLVSTTLAPKVYCFREAFKKAFKALSTTTDDDGLSFLILNNVILLLVLVPLWLLHYKASFVQLTLALEELFV